jgi:hypothetical protein
MIKAPLQKSGDNATDSGGNRRRTREISVFFRPIYLNFMKQFRVVLQILIHLLNAIGQIIKALIYQRQTVKEPLSTRCGQGLPFNVLYIRMGFGAIRMENGF